ncbi:MAG: FlgD immunoglobulin-like domain containing protein [Flavobacteriales bacterium]
MPRLLVLVVLFIASVFVLVRFNVAPSGDSGGPMGGGADDPEGLRAWNLERTMDPATGLVPADIRRKELAFASTLPHRTEAKSLNWTWRGPRNRGGRTRAVVVDITNDQVLIAGSVTGGLWRSTDAGATWTRTSPTDAMTGISSLVQDPRTGHQNEWYAGTGENYGVVSGTSFSALLPGDGMFKSTDGGQSWTHMASTIAGDHNDYNRKGSFKQVNSIVVDPSRNDSDIVLAAVFGGIFRSNDGGTSWRPTLGIDTTITQTSLYTEVRVTSTGAYYAGIGNTSPSEGFWRSPDGLNWTEISPSPFTTNLERTVLAIDPSNENVVYFFSETPGSGIHGHSLWKYRYVSGDGTGAGGVWENRSSNLPNGSCTGYFTFDFGYINSQTSYDMALAVHPADSNVLFLSGTNVYRSKDAFASPDSTKWIGGYRCNTVDPKSYVYPNHHPDQHCIAFGPNNASIMYTGNDGGVQRSNDPLADSVQWTDLNTTYITSQFYTVHVMDNGTDNRILGGLQDNGMWLSVSDDPNLDWKMVHQDDGAYGALAQGGQWMLGSSQQGRLYKKSLDASGNVTGFERIDPAGATGYNFINPLVVDPWNSNTVYWPTGYRLQTRSDLGSVPVTDNWYTAPTTGWTNIAAAQLSSGMRISTLDISAARNNRLCYATTTGRFYRLDSLHTIAPVRTDVDWPDWPSAYVSCVAPNDHNADEWLLTFSNYNVKSVWHTTDAGDTWTDISGNLEQNADGSGNGPACYWAAIYPAGGGDPARYFVGTSVGLFSTDLLDGTNTVWEMEGAATIGNVPINSIAVRTADGLIAVGTHGNGVYSSHLTPVVGVQGTEAGNSIGAWPNPAHERITFDLPNGSSMVKVEIHDATGRLVLQRDLAASSQWTWDLRVNAGGRVRNGTYLVRLGKEDPIAILVQ